MLSILIPTYNYSIRNLLVSLDEILKVSDIDYEILCWEDGSTSYLKDNKASCDSIANGLHIISDENRGRVTTRKSLAEKAKYDWLLFLDADVIPENKDFIKKYLNTVKDNDSEAIYGGCSYDLKKPDNDYILRWRYGIRYEQVKAEKRNKNPYKHIVSANFLIKKDMFLKVSSKITDDGYGYDLYFGAIMKSLSVKVCHIDNFAIHKGLDKNSEFLEKVKTSVSRLNQLNQDINNYDNSLLQLFKKLKRYRLQKIVAATFFLVKRPLTNQLLSRNPNIKLLQFYKLGYLCSLSSNKK